MRTIYDEDGVVLGVPLFTRKATAELNEAMDAVLDQQYELSVEPTSINWRPGDSPDTLRQIKDEHLANAAIRSILSDPMFGRWVARFMGAAVVTIFHTQLLFKPSQSGDMSAIGWHRDSTYLGAGVITGWLALSDVTMTSGPVLYIQGSHRWPDFGASRHFHDGNLETSKTTIKVAISDPQCRWIVLRGMMPQGCISFIHSDTLHGSDRNFSEIPRRSIAIHMRTFATMQEFEASPAIGQDESVGMVIHGL